MSKLFNLGLFQKHIGANQPITAATIKLGNTKGRGSSTRIFNYCKQNSPDPSECINQFVNIEKKSIFNPPLNIYGTFFPLTDIPSSTITPSKLLTAYNVPVIPPNNVRQVIVTIISCINYSNIYSDLIHFCNVSNLPPPNGTNTIEIHNPYNKPPRVYDNNNNNNPMNRLIYETCLDVQACYTINPHAKIRLIISNSNTYQDLINIIIYSNNKNNFNPSINTDILSISYGVDDSNIASAVKQKLIKIQNFCSNIKTCYVCACGDSGLVPNWPATDPNILAVGATKLTLDQNNKRANESIWLYTGSGPSQIYPKLSYQPTNYNKRVVPDVCALGSHESTFLMTINGNYVGASGTSVSAPLVAGILSLLVQKRLNINPNAISLTTVQQTNGSFSTAIQIQPRLYAHSNYSKFFYDIKKLNGGKVCNANTCMYPGDGYDLVSGLGVIKDVTQFINDFQI